MHPVNEVFKVPTDNSIGYPHLDTVRKLEHWSHFSLIFSLWTLPSLYLLPHFSFTYSLIDFTLSSPPVFIVVSSLMWAHPLTTDSYGLIYFHSSSVRDS